MLMQKRLTKPKFVLIMSGFIVLFVLLFALKDSSKAPKLEISMEDRATNYSSTFLKFTSLGNYRMISSLLWTHTLLFSDYEHYKGNDLNSWMYLRFKAISDLDPKMYENYYWGGQYLSIVKDDVFGAEEIYNLGLKQFPEDLWLNYLSGFNYIYEIGDKEKGIERFLTIKDHPKLMKTIPILPSITAKLLRDSDDLESIFLMVRSAWEKAPDENMKKRYWNSLYAIRAEIDLKCLNENRTNCRKKDIAGNPYVLNNGQYKALREWKKFQTKKRERKKRSP